MKPESDWAEDFEEQLLGQKKNGFDGEHAGFEPRLSPQRSGQTCSKHLEIGRPDRGSRWSART